MHLATFPTRPRRNRSRRSLRIHLQSLPPIRCDDFNDANTNANANPFPVALSSEDRSRFIVNQRLVIASLINQFWVHREVHYTTINSTSEVVYQASLFDLMQLDLLIYEIVYSRERFQLYLSYIRNFPGGTFTPVREHRFDIPDEDDEEHDYVDDKELRGRRRRLRRRPGFSIHSWKAL